MESLHQFSHNISKRISNLILNSFMSDTSNLCFFIKTEDENSILLVQERLNSLNPIETFTLLQTIDDLIYSSTLNYLNGTLRMLSQENILNFNCLLKKMKNMILIGIIYFEKLINKKYKVKTSNFLDIFITCICLAEKFNNDVYITAFFTLHSTTLTTNYEIFESILLEVLNYQLFVDDYDFNYYKKIIKESANKFTTNKHAGDQIQIDI